MGSSRPSPWAPFHQIELPKAADSSWGTRKAWVSVYRPFRHGWAAGSLEKIELFAFEEGGAPVSGRPGVRGVLDISGLIREHHGVRSEIGAKDLFKQIRALLLLQISEGVRKNSANTLQFLLAGFGQGLLPVHIVLPGADYQDGDEHCQPDPQPDDIWR